MKIYLNIPKLLVLCAVILIDSYSVCSESAELPKGFSFNNKNDFVKYPNFHGGKGIISFKEMFGINEYKTGHFSFRLGMIPPKSGIGEYFTPDADELYIIINGEAEITLNGHTGKVSEGSMVPCKMGETIGLYNSTGEDILFAWLITSERAGVYSTKDIKSDLSYRKPETPCPFTCEYMRKWVASDGSRSHEGKGILKGCNGKFDFPFFKTNYIAQFMVLPADCSIGYHGHNNTEEIYMLMNGKARGTVNDITMDMKTGDASLCSLGDAHGIYNNGKEDIFIFYTAKLKDVNSGFDSENFGDDLSTH